MRYDVNSMVYDYLREAPATRQEICHHFIDALEWTPDRVSAQVQHALFTLGTQGKVEFVNQRWRSRVRRP